MKTLRGIVCFLGVYPQEGKEKKKSAICALCFCEKKTPEGF